MFCHFTEYFGGQFYNYIDDIDYMNVRTYSAKLWWWGDSPIDSIMGVDRCLAKLRIDEMNLMAKPAEQGRWGGSPINSKPSILWNNDGQEEEIHNHIAGVAQ